MKKESRFINECIHAYLENPDLHNLKRFFLNSDASKINTLLQRHDIGGLFYHLYTDGILSGIDVPLPIVELWKKTAWKNTFVNSINDSEAAEIAKLFDLNNIDYAYIKGAVCRKYYEKDYIRSSVDIDLFISRKDYPAAKELLLARGYFIPVSHYINSGIEMSFTEYEDSAKEMSFIKKQRSSDFILDLQWDFIGFEKSAPFHRLYDINSVFLKYNSDIINLNGYDVKTLTMEKELYIMAFHYTFHHGYRGLKWLLDICTYINNGAMSIEGLFKNLTPDSGKIIGVLFLMNCELSGKPRPDKNQKKQMHVDRLLPFEYAIYKKMLFRINEGVANSIAHRFVKLLLPYKHRDKLKVLGYLLFNVSSIKHRIIPTNKKSKLLHPFALIKLIVSDIFRHRRKNK